MPAVFYLHHFLSAQPKLNLDALLRDSPSAPAMSVPLRPDAMRRAPA